jgi:hypothetical protein
MTWRDDIVKQSCGKISPYQSRAYFRTCRALQNLLVFHAITDWCREHYLEEAQNL